LQKPPYRKCVESKSEINMIRGANHFLSHLP
jgi:hypothetical protein